MEYISTKQCAEKWGVSERAVQILCSCNKIVGAKQVGRTWIIPTNAEKPLDGRTKKAKDASLNSNYHFPIFIISELYSAKNALSEEENELLTAQLKYLNGDYYESTILARRIILETNNLHIKIGAYTTIVYCSMLLGLASEFKASIEKIKSLIQTATIFKEDYKLILAGINFHTTWDPSDLFNINISDLSMESLLYYRYIITLSKLVNNVTCSKQMIASISIFLRYSELNKIEPLILILNLIIASIYYKNGDANKCSVLIKQALDIAIKNNWINYVAKYYMLISNLIDNYLKTVNGKYIQIIKNKTQSNIYNWRLLTKHINGKTHLEKIPIELGDFFILLSNGKTNKEIAKILNLSTTTVKEKIDKMIVSVNAKSRKELVDYIKYNLEKTDALEENN